MVMTLVLDPLLLLGHTYLAACELHQCFPPLRRADPQLFFGIDLMLIALSALTFRQMRGPYGFD